MADMDVNLGDAGKDDNKVPSFGKLLSGQIDALGIYFKVLRKVTQRVCGYLWSLLSSVILSWPAVIIILIVFAFMILDTIFKNIGKFYYNLYEHDVSLLKYIWYALAGTIKISLDAVAAPIKGIVELALLALRGVGTAMSAVVMAFNQGDGAILSGRTEMLQQLEQRIQDEASEKRTVEITYTEDQTYETERKETMKKYDKIADMLQYSFRFGKYWEQALATGMVREQQLENYHQMRTETLSTGIEKAEDGSTLLQSVSNKAGQIKDVYYWSYVQALSEKEEIEKKIADGEVAGSETGALEEDLRWAKEKLYGIYMEDNLYEALQQDGFDRYDKKADYVMELYYKDDEKDGEKSVYSQIKEGMADLIDAEVSNVDNTFNRFVGSSGGFNDMTIDEALNSMFQKRYGGYGYPKQYYTTKTLDAENVLGAQVYTYEETAVVAPEKLRIVKVENDTAPDGKVVSCLYFTSEDGTREYKIMGIEEISTFFNEKAKKDYKNDFELKIDANKNVTDKNGQKIVLQSYEYEHIVVPEGTVIGYFGKNLMTMKEKEKLQQRIANREESDLTQEEKDLISKAKGSSTYTYVFVELNEDNTNSVFDVEADFIIPKENKYYFRYALSKKEREGLKGSRLYGGAVTSEKAGHISKVGEGTVKVKDKNGKTYTYENLVSYSEKTQKLLDSVDPYWNSKYYVFVNGVDIDKDKIIGYVKNGSKTKSVEKTKANYKVVGVTRDNNGKITEFELMNVNDSSNKLTYKVVAYKDKMEATEITEIPDHIQTKLKNAINTKITKDDVIGYALVQHATKNGITRELEEVKLPSDNNEMYDILEAGRDDNGLLKVKLKNVKDTSSDNVREYLGLYVFGDNVKNKLENVFNPNSKEYAYAYERWNKTSYDIKDSNQTIQTLSSVAQDGVIGFKGRELEQVNGQYKFTDLGSDETSIISPEDCILTKAGWDNENGWTLQLTSLDYERRYTFSKLSCFSSWIQGVLGSKIGISDYGTGKDWRTSGEYYAIDEYRIIKKGEVIGKMGDSGSMPLPNKEKGEISGESDVMPLIAPETLRVTKMGYKLLEITNGEQQGQDVVTSADIRKSDVIVEKNGKFYVKRLYIDVENLAGTRSYKIENVSGYNTAHTKIKGDIEDTTIKLYDNLHTNIEYEKCYTVDQLEYQDIAGVEYEYSEGEVKREGSNPPEIKSAVKKMIKTKETDDDGEVQKTVLDLEVSSKAGIKDIILIDRDGKETKTNFARLYTNGKKQQFELEGAQINVSKIKVVSIDGSSIEKEIVDRTIINTTTKEILGYKLQPLYIYEGETIAYARIKDTTTEHLLVTKITPKTTEHYSYPFNQAGQATENISGINNLLDTTINKKAKITDLMAPLHVDVSIEKFDNLVPENLETKYKEMTTQIITAKKESDTIDVTYQVSNHNIEKLECYNSKGELIGTNELNYTSDKTKINKVFYYINPDKKEEVSQNSTTIDLGNCKIKATNIKDVAQIRAYNTLGSSSNYNFLEITDKTITSYQEKESIALKVLKAKDDEIQKIEYYDKDKKLLYTKTVKSNENKDNLYSADIYKVVGEVSQIKVYSKQGKVAYLKPEILAVSENTNDNTIELSFAQGMNELQKVEYYKNYEISDENKLAVEKATDEQVMSTQSDQDVTLQNAKVTADVSYTSKVKVSDDNDKVKMIAVYDTTGKYDIYKYPKLISADLVGDGKVEIKVNIDSLDALNKARYYGQDGSTFIAERTIDDKYSTTQEIDAPNQAKYIEIQTENGHKERIEINKGIRITGAEKIGDNKIRVHLINAQKASTITVYDNQNKSIGSEDVKADNTSYSRDVDVKISNKNISKIKVVSGGIEDEYLYLAIESVSLGAKNEVSLKLILDDEDEVASIACYNKNGTKISEKTVSSTKDTQTITINPDVTKIVVTDKYNQTAEYTNQILPKITSISGTGQKCQVSFVKGINPLSRVDIFDVNGKHLGGQMFTNQSDSTEISIKDSSLISKAMIYDNKDNSTEYTMIRIENVEKISNNKLRVTISNNENANVNVSGDSIEGKTVQAVKSDDITYVIESNEPIQNVYAKSANFKAQFIGPDITKAEMVSTADGIVLRMTAKATDSDNISNIEVCDKDGKTIKRVSGSSKKIDTNIKLSDDEAIKAYILKVVDKNGLVAKEVIKDNTAENIDIMITSIDRDEVNSADYTSMRVYFRLSENLQASGMEFFDESGVKIDLDMIINKDYIYASTKGDNKYDVSKVRKIVLHAKYKNVVNGTDIKAEYELFKINEIYPDYANNSIYLNIKDMKIEDVIVDYKLNDDSEMAATYGDYQLENGKKYNYKIYDKQGVGVSIMRVQSSDGDLIEFNAPQITLAEKVKVVEQAEGEYEQINAKASSSNKVDKVVLWCETDSLGNGVLHEVKDWKQTGNEITITEKTKTLVEKARKIRVYDKNGFMGEEKIINTTQGGTLNITQVTSGQNASNIKYYVLKGDGDAKRFTEMKLLDSKGQELYYTGEAKLTGLAQLTQITVTEPIEKTKSDVNIMSSKDKANINKLNFVPSTSTTSFTAYCIYSDKIAKIGLVSKDDTGYHESWYNLVELDSISSYSNAISVNTSVRLKGALTCGIKNVKFRTIGETTWKEVKDSYVDPLNKNIAGYNIPKEGNLQVRIEANNGVILEYSAPTIEIAKNVSEDKNKVKLGYSINYAGSLDRIEYWNQTSKLGEKKNPNLSDTISEISPNATQIKAYTKEGLVAKKDIEDSRKDAVLQIESVEKVNDTTIRVNITQPYNSKVKELKLYDSNDKLFNIQKESKDVYEINTNAKVSSIEAIAENGQTSIYEGPEITLAKKTVKTTKTNKGIVVEVTLKFSVDDKEIKETIEKIELYDNDGNELDNISIALMYTNDGKNKGEISYLLKGDAQYATKIKVYSKTGLVSEKDIEDEVFDDEIRVISIEKKTGIVNSILSWFTGDKYEVKITTPHVVKRIERYNSKGESNGGKDSNTLDDTEGIAKIRVYYDDLTNYVEYELAKIESAEKLSDNKIRVVARETQVAESTKLEYYGQDNKLHEAEKLDGGVYIIPEGSVYGVKLIYDNGASVETPVISSISRKTAVGKTKLSINVTDEFGIESIKASYIKNDKKMEQDVNVKYSEDRKTASGSVEISPMVTTVRITNKYGMYVERKIVN